MPDPEAVDRRGFLKKLVGGGAVAATAAGGASALLAQPAGAVVGDNLQVNQTKAATTAGAGTTGLTGSKFAVSQSTANAIALEATSNTGVGLKIVNDGGAILMPPTSGTWTRGSLRVNVDPTFTDLSDIWYCYADGAGSASGWYPLSLIPAFIPLAAPQRIYDSRDHAGKIFNNQEVEVDATFGGFIPGSAFAILMNLSVFQTSGTIGFLSVFSSDVAWPGTSNINWYAANQTIANNATTGFDANGMFTVHCGTNGSTNFVVDAMGFYTLTA